MPKAIKSGKKIKGPFSHDPQNDLDKQIEVLDPDQDEKVCFIIEAFGMAYTKKAVILAFRKQYAISLEHTYRYIRIAEYLMQEDLLEDRKKSLAKAFARVQSIIRGAQKSGDFKAAITATAYHDKLRGLVNPENPLPEGQNATEPAGNDVLDLESARAIAALIASNAESHGGLESPALDLAQGPDGGRKAV